jgi:PAP2 superfamily
VCRALIVVSALAVAIGVAADDAPAPDLRAGSAPREWGRLLGPEYRYDELNVVGRTLVDLVAIPANVDGWGTDAWLQAGAVGATVAVLMMPRDPSLDVRLDRWLRRDVNGGSPLVWNDVMQPLLWSSIAVGGIGTWLWAAQGDHPDAAQGLSLMAESLAVSQAYHLGFKLLIGREGPRDGSMEGRVLGPGRALRYYPGGTPSGHAATLYGLLGAGLAYFDPPWWAHAAGHLAAGSLVAFHVIDHRHYLSESLWGAAMGWSVGQWVVRHRATRAGGPDEDRAFEARLVAVTADGATGVGVAGRF